jgi:Protein of unknown function (DUF2442)
MKMVPCVVKAEYQGDYRIHVTFDDDSEKTVDFSTWLRGPVFEPLKDTKYFRRFYLDGWTIAWPNGADIAPETLYECADVSAAIAPRRRPTARIGRERRRATGQG